MAASPLNAAVEQPTLSPPGLVTRLRCNLPSWRVAVAGAVLWSCAMAASATANLLAAGWLSPAKVVAVAVLYALGAAIAFPLAYAVARLLAKGRGQEIRITAAFLAFTIVTVGVTSVIYALDYRQYYAAWHAEVFSVTWMFQLAFTTAGALVQFAVTGVRLYFPVGFIALLAVSFWFARLKH